MSIGWLFRFGFAILLDLVVLFYLARGFWKRFPLVGIFCITQIVASSTDTVVSLLIKPARSLYFQIYWTGDFLAHAVILLLIISLIWQTLGEKSGRIRFVRLLTVGIIGFVVASIFVFHDPHINRWMTPLSRNMSFCEEVLNLILWSLLLQRRASDYLLLMVSAGIGVQVTGEVIGHTLRLYSHSSSTVEIPNLLVYISEIVCLAIWIWAFRAARGATGKRDLSSVQVSRA